MTTFTFPAGIAPSLINWGGRTNSRAFRSPTTGATQTASRKGSRWRAQLVFNNIVNPNKAILSAFFHSLNGQQHRMFVPDATHYIRGTIAGTPLIAGASQTGTTVNIDGWTGTLLAGDRIGFNGELKEITADHTSTGAGISQNLSIWPEIHNSPANNAVVDFTNPVGTFILADEEVVWHGEPWGPTNKILFASVVNIIEDIT